jgi:hypothetical protein
MRTSAVSLLLITSVIGCAGRANNRAVDTAAMCEFAVSNRTPAALEIRMVVGEIASTPIGALNPGELLTHSTPCWQERVVIVGTGITSSGERSGYLRRSAGLRPGERVLIALHWP